MGERLEDLLADAAAVEGESAGDAAHGVGLLVEVLLDEVHLEHGVHAAQVDVQLLLEGELVRLVAEHGDVLDVVRRPVTRPAAVWVRLRPHLQLLDGGLVGDTVVTHVTRHAILVTLVVVGSTSVIICVVVTKVKVFSSCNW